MPDHLVSREKIGTRQVSSKGPVAAVKDTTVRVCVYFSSPNDNGFRSFFTIVVHEAAYIVDKCRHVHREDSLLVPSSTTTPGAAPPPSMVHYDTDGPLPQPPGVL